MKRFFLFLWTLSLAALGWVLWQRRDDLKRSYGEWRAATDAARGSGGADSGERQVSSGQRPSRGPRVNGPVPASPRQPGPHTAAAPAASSPATEPVRCAATTGSGKRCTRAAEKDSRFCWQHAD